MCHKRLNFNSPTIENSLVIYKENTTAAEVLYVIKIHLNLHRDFLSLDSINFEKIFVSYLNKIVRLLSY